MSVSRANLRRSLGKLGSRAKILVSTVKNRHPKQRFERFRIGCKNGLEMAKCEIGSTRFAGKDTHQKMCLNIGRLGR